ncbi:MAG: prolyl oligopeptidase family serine peptidase [Jatrophihabitantaceae bacterium]
MEVTVNIYFPEPPAFAELAPTRGVYVGDVEGRCEVFGWDTERAESHQLTDRAQGTVSCAIDPTGEQVWWFDDDLSGVGAWQVQPFDGGGPGRSAGFPSGRAAGLAMAMDGTVAAAVSDERGFGLYFRRPGGPVELLLQDRGYAQLVDLSGSGEFAVLAGEPDTSDAVTIVAVGSGEITRLSGVANQLWAAGFAPGPGPARLLLAVAVEGGYRLGVWSEQVGLSVLDGCHFDTEIAPSWYPDGQRVLVRQDRHGRSVLQAVDLRDAHRTVLDTPAGTILAAVIQPDGDLHYVWTDSSRPPRLRTSSGLRLPGGHGGDDGQPGRQDEVWVPTPAGRVHALLHLPDSAGPHPAVFLLHGGPFEAAQDAYDPMVAVLLSIGCAVVRPNYRGSTGYGEAWRNDFSDGVGLTQLADIASVREHLVAAGTISRDRTAVYGESWGGYLALLAAGAQSQLWAAVAAVNPIADYAAAFEETTLAVRALDTRLFGGSPAERPEAYARSSPVSYVENVRGPVLLVAGTDDPKCPPGQVRDYADRLRARGVDVESRWTRSGHEGYRADVLVEVLASVVSFLATAMGGRPAPLDSGAAQSAGHPMDRDSSELSPHGMGARP